LDYYILIYAPRQFFKGPEQCYNIVSGGGAAGAVFSTPDKDMHAREGPGRRDRDAGTNI